MASKEKHSSGLDFADKPPPSGHPDTNVITEDPGFMQRNKAEQSRLQGLMKPSGSPNSVSGKRRLRKSLFPAWDRWMVNDGGRKLFFFVFVLTQGIVAGLGFLNYFFKDNLNNARATFGITYREFVCYLNNIF
jgi:NADPH oxidase 2